MGSTLSFDSSHQEVTLFLANLTKEFDDDDALRKKMGEFGTTLRCFIGRNPAGQSKVRRVCRAVPPTRSPQNYGMVEFQLPSAAAKAKEWADGVEASMRPTRDSEVCFRLVGGMLLSRASGTGPVSAGQAAQGRVGSCENREQHV